VKVYCLGKYWELPKSIIYMYTVHRTYYASLPWSLLTNIRCVYIQAAWEKMATAKQLDELRECPICAEMYSDPRVLPCGHTLCFKCIKKCREELCTGNQMACPMCRTEFTIPSSGVGGLPKNFFAADFLQMKELTIRIPKKSAPASHCDQHKDEPLKIYCLGCKVVICAMCYIQLHGGHEWSDVCQVVGEFSKQMRTDAGSITNGVEKCRQILHRLEKEWKVFGNQVDKAGREINEKAQQLERMIGVHRDELNAEQLKKMIYFERDKQVAELSSLQQKRTKEIERVREEIETQLASMESYKECVNELIE